MRIEQLSESIRAAITRGTDRIARAAARAAFLGAFLGGMFGALLLAAGYLIGVTTNGN